MWTCRLQFVLDLQGGRTEERGGGERERELEEEERKGEEYHIL
jgi:hypothetical protein